MRLKWILEILFLLIIMVACSINDIHKQIPEVSIDDGSENVVIAFAHKSVNSYFYTIMNEAVKRAVDHKGWVFESSVADYDPMRQNQQIVNFIKQSPDVILTTAIDSIAIEEVIILANDSQIPVCTIDTNTVGGILAIDVSFDNYKAGQMAAELIIEQLKEKYGKPEGTVFNAYGELTSNAWRLRKEGFESVINQYPEIEYIPRATEGQPEFVKEALLELLDEGIQVDAVHTPSEHPARGLVDALKESKNWFPVGEEGHVIMVTIDAEPYFVHLISEGYSDGAIAQDVIAYGNITIDLIDTYILTGKPIPAGPFQSEGTYWKVSRIENSDGQAKVIIPPYVIDSENCKDQRHWAYTAEKIWGFQYNR